MAKTAPQACQITRSRALGESRYEISGLTGADGTLPYAEAARRLETTEAAVKMAVRRLRLRYSECLRLEVAHTVASPQDIDEELRFLIAAAAR